MAIVEIPIIINLYNNHFFKFNIKRKSFMYIHYALLNFENYLYNILTIQNSKLNSH